MERWSWLSLWRVSYSKFSELSLNPEYFRIWNNYIYEYTTASTAEAAYIIGGGPLFMDTIAKYENDGWSKYGKLHRGRQAHGVIQVGATTFVIGGMTEFNM